MLDDLSPTWNKGLFWHHPFLIGSRSLQTLDPAQEDPRERQKIYKERFVFCRVCSEHLRSKRSQSVSAPQSALKDWRRADCIIHLPCLPDAENIAMAVVFQPWAQAKLLPCKQLELQQDIVSENWSNLVSSLKTNVHTVLLGAPQFWHGKWEKPISACTVYLANLRT